jgi:hypothetical protein
MVKSVNSLIRNAGRLGSLDGSAVANLPEGAQLGIGPHLTQLDVATPLVMGGTFPFVLQSPTMFSLSPQLQNFDSFLKVLIERGAKSITGIDFEKSIDAQQVNIGNDGQMLNMPTTARRSQVNPQFTWNELTGNVIFNFFGTYLDLIKHPDTQASMVGILESGEIDPQLVSSFTFDTLFIQYDTTMRARNILDAYIITAMWPDRTGMAGYERTIAESKLIERSIPFHGILQHNDNTRRVGRNVAELVQIHRADYNRAKPVAETIAENLANMGIQKEVTDIMDQFTVV